MDPTFPPDLLPAAYKDQLVDLHWGRYVTITTDWASAYKYGMRSTNPSVKEPGVYYREGQAVEPLDLGDIPRSPLPFLEYWRLYGDRLITISSQT